MKRKITYQTTDGKTFNSRIEARKHETDVARNKRMAEYFRQNLPNRDSDANGPTIQKFVTAILKNPNAFAESLSARAARRAAPSS